MQLNNLCILLVLPHQDVLIFLKAIHNLRKFQNFETKYYA